MDEYPEKPKGRRSPVRGFILRFVIILVIVLAVMLVCGLVGSRLPGVD